MSRASDYVIALRTSASGSSSKAASNSYVTIVKNTIISNSPRDASLGLSLSIMDIPNRNSALITIIVNKNE